MEITFTAWLIILGGFAILALFGWLVMMLMEGEPEDPQEAWARAIQDHGAGWTHDE